MRSPVCVRAATAISRTRPSTSPSCVEEGARAYIERINIRGNTRTRDYVIRREFDIGEGDAYNRALIDRAERRLKNLNYFKTVKITNEPGSAPDRVVINVDVEEQSTGEFSISGGYSTSDGFLAEVSVADRNLMGRGQFAKASVTYGQYSRGVELSFRRALSAWLPHGRRHRPVRATERWRRTTCPTTRKTVGVNLRLGFALTEELSFAPRYSIYRQEITLPDYLNNCSFSPNRADQRRPGRQSDERSDLSGQLPRTAPASCYADGEASLPVRMELANGAGH